ncbi:MAG TPA: hypothetical protein PKZ16_02870 [bacterium]|nr:hypothetical protein [bacterium]HPL95366.1 hypothetical protein [bacterium]
MPFYSSHLRDGEQIIAIIRRHWLTILPQIIICVLLFFIPFFFMFPLFDLGTIGQIIFSLLLGIAFLYLIKLSILTYYNCLIITTKRIIDFHQKKSLERKVQEADFLDIADVSYQIKGLFQILSRSGNLMIKSKNFGAEPNIVIVGIKKPMQIQNLIIDLKKLAEEENKINNNRHQVQASYREILQKIKADIGPDGVKKLLSNLESTTADQTDKDKNKNNKNDIDLEFLK